MVVHRVHTDVTVCVESSLYVVVHHHYIDCCSRLYTGGEGPHLGRRGIPHPLEIVLTVINVL